MKKELALLGCGKLANIIVDAVLHKLNDDYRLVGVYSRTKEKAETLADKINCTDQGACRVFNSSKELIERKPDFIVEAASIAAMKECAVPALRNSISIITLSIGALAEEEFFQKVSKTALENNAKIYIGSGAIGGLDVLRTTTLMGQNPSLTFRTEKGPASLRDSTVYDERLEREECEVFRGNAQEAIDMFPTKVNVAVAAALASVGTEKARVAIHSIPCYEGDNHRIEIKNDEVQALIQVYSKQADIAAWSVVRVLQNITAPIVF